MIRTTVGAIELALQRDAQPTKKAPSFTITLVVALALMVEDKTRCFVFRAYAWVLLVRVWVGLRTDDCGGLLPDTIKVSVGGLEARGPDRKVRWLPVFVSREAFIAREEWLACGALL